MSTNNEFVRLDSLRLGPIEIPKPLQTRLEQLMQLNEDTTDEIYEHLNKVSFLNYPI